MDNQSAPAEPTDARVRAALKDYLERIDRGEPLDRETFFAQHADIARELRSFLDAEDVLRKLARSRRSEKEAGDSTQSFSAHGQETIAPRGGAPRSGANETSGLKQEFGRYRIVRQLGQGAMGAVYLAEDTQLERQVALKTPHFETQPTSELLERFYREARAAATLRHPNICPVYDVGQIEGTHYISMAYIEGNPLSAFVRTKPQPERQIVLVVRKLAQALQEAHDHGIVHRDLKPANIMVDKRNEPIIMDFGLARQLQREKNIRITQSGMLIGTPAYMSPEQIDGEPDKVGPLSDQYSLGVILYELLTGQLPFRGSLTAVMAQILTKETTRPSQLRPDVDLRIEAACLKMMAKDPAQRFASLSAVAEELAGILKNPAGKQVSKEPTDKAAGPGPAADPVAASGIRQSMASKSLVGAGKAASLAAADVASLEELARKCLGRRDYDQVIQIVERVPEEKRGPGLAEVFEKARAKADEISFLIVEIDEAVRFNDAPTALRKADELLKVKPGHHRALKVQQEFAGYGSGGAARIGLVQQFTQPWNEGGWIPWSVLAFGLAIFGVMTAVMVIWINRTVLVVDARVPGVQIEMKGQKSAVITVEGEQSVTVTPGDQVLTISYAGLQTQTKQFSIEKGKTKKLRVWIADKSLIAQLEGEKFDGRPDAEKVRQAAKGVVNRSKEGQTKKALALAAVGKDRAKPKTRPVPQGPVPAPLAAPFDEPAAKAARQKWADYLKEPPEISNTIGMRLMLIAPGEFQMGAAPQSRTAEDREKPQHPVKITHAYYIGAHEVTRGQFAAFVAATGYKTEAERDGGKAAVFNSRGEPAVVHDVSWKKPGFEQDDSHPVVIVSWSDADAFCRWLSQKEGQTYRLPSEAEWEYACRAGTTTPLITGNRLNDLFSVGNGLDATFRKHFHMPAPDARPPDGFVFTAPVGSFLPNRFGLYDMHGNVWEWCQDWFAPYTSAPATDPTGPAQGDQRISRGGGFDCGMKATSTRRDVLRPVDRVANLGFRVVRTIAPELSAPASQAAAAPASEFVSLFNGRDLTGWKLHPSQRGDWRVENGILVGFGPGVSHLYSERGDFRDFHLRVEARINAAGNSGIFGRASFGPRWPLKDPRWPQGYEAQIESGGKDVNKTGSLYLAEHGVVVSVRQSPAPPNHWFTEELIVQGNEIVVKVNGRTMADYIDNDPKPRFQNGHIALQQHDPQTVVEFRKIEIQELAPVATSAKIVPREQDTTFATTNAARTKTTQPKAIRSTKRYTDRQAAEFVLSLHGTVSVRQAKEHRIEPGKPLPAKPFRLVRVIFSHNAQVTDASLEPLRGLTGLLELDLSKSEGITDAGLDSIRNLHTLDELHLTETSIGDAGLACVERLTRLKSLMLGKTLVTSAGLVHLRGLTRLEKLWLHQTSVGDAGLEHLRGLTELRDLLLWETRVTDAGLVHLKPLHRLEALMLSGNEISDAGMAHLRSLGQLKKLWLTEANLTDAGVPDLVALSQLRELNLRGTRITDTGLLQLQSLKKLRQLTVSGTKVTAEGVEKLRQALPACQIKS